MVCYLSFLIVVSHDIACYVVTFRHVGACINRLNKFGWAVHFGQLQQADICFSVSISALQSVQLVFTVLVKLLTESVPGRVFMVAPVV